MVVGVVLIVAVTEAGPIDLPSSPATEQQYLPPRLPEGWQSASGIGHADESSLCASGGPPRTLWLHPVGMEAPQLGASVWLRGTAPELPTKPSPRKE